MQRPDVGGMTELALEVRELSLEVRELALKYGSWR
jgi:hypothetical protein